MRPRCDWTLLGVVGILVGVGLLMIFSTSSIVGRANYGDSYFFIKRHLVYLILGSIACRLGYLFPHSYFRRLALLGYGGGVFALLMVFVPSIGVSVGGATRWIQLAGIRFQPVEIMKLGIVVIVANYLANKTMSKEGIIRGALPIVMLLVVPIILLLKQPDLGNTLVLTTTVGVMWLVSGVPWGHIAGLFSVAVGGVIKIILSNPYQLDRVKTFLDPWQDPLGKGYHITQSFMAIGSGGISGLGLGEGKLKYYYLPLQYSDFIFSILCEEGGLILASVCLTLFFLFFVRGIVIIRAIKNDFSRYLALGLVSLILFQAFLNIGGVIGVVPVSGIPLPFISFGGTSLVMSLFIVGVLLNISSLNEENESIKSQEKVKNEIIEG